MFIAAAAQIRRHFEALSAADGRAPNRNCVTVQGSRRKLCYKCGPESFTTSRPIPATRKSCRPKARPHRPPLREQRMRASTKCSRNANRPQLQRCFNYVIATAHGSKHARRLQAFARDKTQIIFVEHQSIAWQTPLLLLAVATRIEPRYRSGYGAGPAIPSPRPMAMTADKRLQSALQDRRRQGPLNGRYGSRRASRGPCPPPRPQRSTGDRSFVSGRTPSVTEHTLRATFSLLIRLPLACTCATRVGLEAPSCVNCHLQLRDTRLATTNALHQGYLGIRRRALSSSHSTRPRSGYSLSVSPCVPRTFEGFSQDSNPNKRGRPRGNILVCQCMSRDYLK